MKRPRRNVLLWGPIDERVRHVAYVLELRLPVRCYLADNLNVFREASPRYDACVLLHATAGQLVEARSVLGARIVWFGPNDDMATLLGNLKIAIARKRGPAKKPPASVVADETELRKAS